MTIISANNYNNYKNSQSKYIKLSSDLNNNFNGNILNKEVIVKKYKNNYIDDSDLKLLSHGCFICKFKLQLKPSIAIFNLNQSLVWSIIFIKDTKNFCKYHGEGNWPDPDTCGSSYYICASHSNTPYKCTCDNKPSQRPKCFQKSSNQCKYCNRIQGDPPSENFDCQRDVKDLYKHH